MIVRLELEKLGLYCITIELGKVETMGTIIPEDIQKIRNAFLPYGLTLIDDKKSILIERIKNVIIEMVHHSESELKLKTNFSNYLAEKLNHDYTYLSNIFSASQGITIERFIILHKVQRVKELIAYDELNLTEISWKLHYSSVAHLSTQFKKVTGITPSSFKAMEHKSMTMLENV